MIVTNMKDYVTLDPDDDDADFRYNYADTMTAHFKQDLYNKNISLQDQSKGDHTDTLQNRSIFWFNIIHIGVQYLIIFMIMIITTKDWIVLFAVQRYILRSEN